MQKVDNRVIITVCLVGIGSLAIGVIIGYFSKPDSPDWVPTVEALLDDVDKEVISTYVKNVKAENIQNNLRNLTEKPHLAATDQDNVLVNQMKNDWDNYLDEAYITSHNVLLSYPSKDVDKKNVAVVIDDDTGEEVFRTESTEKVLEGMQASEDIVQYYNAYAPSGDVKGGLVFANYGTEEDFKVLYDMGVELNGTIALTKYGRTGRGTRTHNAAVYGVSGVLVYSDPEYWVVEGEKGYPEDFSLPSTGVQRGSAMGEFGDPSTPWYPSTMSAYRIPNENIDIFPALPLQPINYADAEKLLHLLGGLSAPDDFTTGLDVTTLKVGPEFNNESYSLQLSVNNELEYRISHNVIGVIRGSDDPDSYVLYGNHRDAWVYGSVDPTSGTACMMEMTRVMGDLLKDGWRPKRTIIFGSWGTEEFGLIGSTEWAQENSQLLEGRAVAYINVDIAVFANETFFARSSALMKKVLIAASKKVEDPTDSEKTAFDTWLSFHPDSSGENPNVGRLYTSSDYGYFYQALGVSCGDLSYRGNTSKPRFQISPYPTYHTAYDTFDYVNRFIDPGFIAHKTVAKIAGTAVLMIADSLVIPYDTRDLAEYIQFQISQTVKQYETKLSGQGITLDYLKESGNNFSNSAIDLHKYIDNDLDRKNPLAVAAVNNRLVMVERSFIEPRGLPGQINLRHVSGSPPVHDDDSSVFPSLLDALYKIEDDDEEAWTVVKQQLAMITYRINNAVKVITLDDAFV